jgi:hypothetical protein
VKERRAWVGVPEGWAVEARDRVGPFVTREVYRLPDGTVRRWNSRRHRKQRDERAARAWWAPRSLSWWISVLFMIGSTLFGLGTFPPYANAVDAGVVGLTYFVGSLFFTSAGYLQYAQVVNTPSEVNGTRGPWRSFGWQPGRIDWCSATVQSVGTLLFNVSTFAAMDAALNLQRENRLVWAPDMLGSVCFLIASWLAWEEVCHRWWAWRPRDVSWWIVALNLGGSIAFQISAIAAFIRPTTGTYANLQIANLGTFVGAVGFFFGALLLIPEMQASADD